MRRDSTPYTLMTGHDIFGRVVLNAYVNRLKAKAFPLHAMGERKYSSYSFLISAIDGGDWSASVPGRTSAPGKGPTVPFVQEAGWSEPVWTQRLEEKSFWICRGSNLNRPVQSVARHYTDWATPAPCQQPTFTYFQGCASDHWNTHAASKLFHFKAWSSDSSTTKIIPFIQAYLWVHLRRSSRTQCVLCTRKTNIKPFSWELWKSYVDFRRIQFRRCVPTFAICLCYD
jgi:hypothetical protein